MGDGLLWSAALAALAGVVVLRLAWSLKQRSPGANAAGWALLVLAVALGGTAAGAWGIAVASLVAMAAAALLLGWAASTSPRGRAGASNRRAGMLPETDEPLHFGRRALTFVLVALAALAASIALAIGLRAAALGLGWNEADANAVALMAVPLAWGALATMLLMQRSRRMQVTTLVLASLPLVPTLLIGS